MKPHILKKQVQPSCWSFFLVTLILKTFSNSLGLPILQVTYLAQHCFQSTFLSGNLLNEIGCL